MSTARITRSYSVVFFATVAVFTACISYVVLLLIAGSSVYFPYLLLQSTGVGFRLQALLLFVAGVAVAGGILWSLVPRKEQFEAPGPALERGTHPALFTEIDEIAMLLNEPLPDEVYLVGHPNAAVTEHGGFLGFGRRRVLFIGLPLFSIMTVNELRAVLAHEFAHFYSGDTVLGPWVYKAHRALVGSFKNVASLREIGRVPIMQLLLSVVIWTIDKYFLFFLYTTNFVSRRQEFRSDELAALTAGSDPMIHCLELLHGAASFWPVYWAAEVAPLIATSCIPPISEGFRQFLASPSVTRLVASSLAEESKGGTNNPFNSHPPLQQRITALRKVVQQSPECGELPAFSLLREPRMVEIQLVEAANPQLPRNSLRQVPWSDVANLVAIPHWRSEIKKFGYLLGTVSIPSIPKMLGHLSKIALQIPNPEGTLLTMKERERRAAHLLSKAVSLALLEKGWELRTQPAVCEFHRGDERLDVFALVDDLVAGKISAEEWAQKCSAFGIADEKLGMLSTQPGTAVPA